MGRASRLVALGLSGLLSGPLALSAGCSDENQRAARRDAGPALDTSTDTAGAPDRELAPLDVGGPVDVGANDARSSGFDGGAIDEAPASVPATIIVMPDTQYYSAGYPQVYAQQTSWIVSQIQPLHIDAVLHVGDLVDGFDDPAQWAGASTAMHALDNLVPYLVVPGNHDTDANRSTPIDSYFGPASLPSITGTMTPGQIENNYALFDIGPQKWLVLGLEFGPRDAVIAWADQILERYSDRPAIVVTHAYLYRDGNRYDIDVSGLDASLQPPYQSFIPQSYFYTTNQGSNDGEMLWRKLIHPHRNVRMVLCGHDTGWARLTSSRPDGSRVHQMLSDSQWWSPDQSESRFGFGWLRIVQLDYGKKTIAVHTYSPYLQQYLTDDANQFTLDWNL